MTAGSALREALAAAALADIPKLLTLLDRTPTSATYGCFDRAYWHYRMIDFPSGMSQEFVLPLALAWALPIPGNPYYQAPAIREWVAAGVRFAAASAHRDGSCDDYYPFERAAGATAFSLYACLEAIRLTEFACDPAIAEFLRRRAGWLAGHHESGRLSNHEALIVACLARMEEREPGGWEDRLCARITRLLSWQSAEGWFDEYGGADPGYLSLTIGLLAETDRRRPDLGLREPLDRALDFFAAALHPDGSVGGEYASRGTLNFFPHGFEIAAGWRAEAAAINDRALCPLAEGRQPSYADDHIVGHHLWSWLMAWAEWRDARPGPIAPAAATRRFDDARLLVDVHGETRLHLGWSRGGAFKLFEGAVLIASDTGPALVTHGGRAAATHLEGPAEVSIEKNHVIIAGRMAWTRSTLFTPLKSIVLRLMMLSAGRFLPNLIRRLLQRILITGRRDAPFAFRRELIWHDGGWTITDMITPERGWDQVKAIGIGNSQVSTTTIMARVWQSAQLAPWIDLSDRLAGLKGATPLIVTRRLTPMKKLVGLSVSLAIMAALWWRIDLRVILAAVHACDPAWLALSLAAVVPLTLATAWRFALLVRPAIGLAAAARLILSSSTLNLILPSKMGDVAKAWVLTRRYGFDGGFALAVVVIEKLLDLAALLIWGVAALVWIGALTHPLPGLALAATATLLALLLIVLSPSSAAARLITGLARSLPRGIGNRIGQFGNRWGEAIGWFWQDRARAGRLIALSLAIWAGHLGQFWLFVRTIGPDIPFIDNMAFATLAILVGLLPFTIAGIGTRDAAIVLLYGGWLRPGQAAVLGVLATSRYLIPALAGLPFIRDYWAGRSQADATR